MRAREGRFEYSTWKAAGKRGLSDFCWQEAQISILHMFTLGDLAYVVMVFDILSSGLRMAATGFHEPTLCYMMLFLVKGDSLFSLV